MKKYIQLLLVILLFNCQFSQAQSLNDYMVIAAENNPGLKASYNEFEASIQQSAQVKALPDLTLSFGYFVSPVETRVGPQRARFSLVQMFPWFGTNATRESASEQRAQAKYFEFVDKKNELYYKVQQAYYPLVELHDHLNYQRENLDILETYKRLATSNFANDKGSMVDVVRVDIMIDNAKTEIELLNAKIEPLEIVFNRLLNRPDSPQVVVISFPAIDENEVFLLDSVISNNPRLLALNENTRAAETTQTLASKQGLPSIGVGLDYAIVDERTDIDVPDNGKDILMPMVSLNLPLFRKKYNAAIQEAALKRQGLEQQSSQVTNELISTFEMEQYKLRENISLIQLYNQQTVKTRQAIELLYADYANSGKDFEEVLRMEQQVIRYNLSKSTATKEYFIARARLDYLTAKSF